MWQLLKLWIWNWIRVFGNYKGNKKSNLVQWHTPSFMVGADCRGEGIIEKLNILNSNNEIT
jgi:hypothetical protein